MAATLSALRETEAVHLANWLELAVLAVILLITRLVARKHPKIPPER